MLSETASRSMLAVFAHPDDEFAIFPWIEDAIGKGGDVHVAWLTDGGWGGQSIERRQRESVSVLNGFGVKTQNMHFLGARLGIADGNLHECLSRAVPVLLQLARETRAEEIMIPAWEGGHQDHDAAHLAGLCVADLTNAPAWEYSLYNGRNLPGALFTVLSLIPREGEVEVLHTSFAHRVKCVATCLRYSSQWKSFVGLLPLYAWQLRSGSAFVRRRAYRDATLQRPHEGRLLYERRTGLTWDAFAAATAMFRSTDGHSGATAQR